MLISSEWQLGSHFLYSRFPVYEARHWPNFFFFFYYGAFQQVVSLTGHNRTYISDIFFQRCLCNVWQWRTTFTMWLIHWAKRGLAMGIEDWVSNPEMLPVWADGGHSKKKYVVIQTPFIQLPVHHFCCCWDLNWAVKKSRHHRPVHWLTQAFLACPHGYRQGAFRQPKPPGHPFRIFTGRIKWDLVGQSAPLGSTMGTRVPSRGFVWMLQRGRAPKLSKDPSAKE